MSAGSEAVLYDIDGDPMAVTNGTAIPSVTSVLVGGGSDGTNARFIKVDSSGNQVMIGLGTAGTPAGGLITIQGDPAGIAIPISGTVTANAGSGNFAVVQATASNLNATVIGTVTANIGTTNGLALDATLAKLTITQGTTLGTNTQVLIGGSVTTVAPTYTTGQISPISVTTAGAIRVDGSGVTQPVSGTVTANAGTGNFTVVQATASNLNTTANQGTANTLANSWPVIISDGTNTQPTGDVIGRAIFHQITDGTTGPVAVKPASTAPVGTDKALVVVISPNQPAISVTTNAPNSVSSISKGYVTTAAVTDVPVHATTYVEQSVNFTGSIASANANDTSAGTGARTVTIYYIDDTGATAGTESATLNGTTGVNLVISTKCFIEKIVVDTVGSGGVNAGIISLYTGANKTGTVVATIAVSDNQTHLAHHYVVSGKTCNITGMTGFNNNSGNQSVFTLRSADLPIANQANVQISDWVTGGLTFQVVRSYDQLIKVPGPARITMYVKPGGTPTIISRGAFDFYDN